MHKRAVSYANATCCSTENEVVVCMNFPRDDEIGIKYSKALYHSDASVVFSGHKCLLWWTSYKLFWLSNHKQNGFLSLKSKTLVFVLNIFFWLIIVYSASIAFCERK